MASTRVRADGVSYRRLLAAVIPQDINMQVTDVERDRCYYIVNIGVGRWNHGYKEVRKIEIPESWGLTSDAAVAKICLEAP